MSTTTEKLLSDLEDIALLLQKAQTNLKKCPKQRLTQGYIETRLQTIDDYWKQFSTAHHNLLKAVPKEKKNEISYFVNEDYYVVEDLYMCLKGDLKDISSMNSSKVSDSKQYTNNSSATFEANIKLPRVQLPTFSGCYEDWTTFKDLFTALVHNNSTLSKVQKLHYLKTTIIGEAEALLKHIQVTESNYDQAWKLLQERFGNKRLIVNSLLRKLFSLKKIPTQNANNIKFLLDTTSECLNSLKTLNVSTDSWDPLVIYLTVQKLDPESHHDWEEFAYKENLNELPTWEELEKFLQTKFRTLELIAPPSKEKTTRSKEYTVHSTTTSAPAATKPRSCIMCKDNHTLCHCKKFTNMEPTERCEYVKTNRLCFNCLAPGHSSKWCRLNMSCRICNKRHHSLVHQHMPRNTNQPDNNIQVKHQVSDQNQEGDDYVGNNLSSHFTTSTTTALLATALVSVKDDSGRKITLRALVDQGSQATFISERAAQLLRLKRLPATGTITGVGSTKTIVKHAAHIELQSRNDDSFKLNVTAYIMPTHITSQLPNQTIPTNTWLHLEGLTLADPDFNRRGRIDVLLGVEVCAHILKGELIKGPQGTPCAQNTSLGWILFGNIQKEGNNNDIMVMHHTLDINTMLKTMWELDNEEKPTLTPDERKCEEIYQTMHTRTQQGQYIVKLPTTTNKLLSIQGNTREIAMKRLQQLERRLDRDHKLREEYIKVMNEYSDMNHMEEVPNNEINKDSFYLPHHPVVREEKETTKVRIVFNASQKGSNDVSLNDELLIGPQLQADMRSLIMKWRMKKICFVADVQRMYRMILVTQEDKDLQRILWRTNPREPVKDFRLTRVTFGTASAPYLAVRTLNQVADDEGDLCPDAAKIIKESFYVDDLMAGKDTVEEAIHTAKAIENILERGGFTLQKWGSNNHNFLKQLEPTKRTSHASLDITIHGTITTLGLRWNMGTDNFEYSLSLPPIAKTITKRTILADVQQLFDPLGWLAPAIIPTKLLIQSLWLQGNNWDDEVDPNIKQDWIVLRDSFTQLNQIKILRWMSTDDKNLNTTEIHGFCDASIKAYGAVAYVRVVSNNKITTHIIAAKTRVAPVKPVSLPRLELCGALLLSRLLKQIKGAMKIPDKNVYAWTDSTIVLSWLQGDATRWHVFVRNRVVEILDNIGSNWFHVQTTDNPADVASRGESVQELTQDELWWNGPNWLREKTITYSQPNNLTTDLEKREVIQTNLKIKDEESIENQFKEFESLEELTKTIIFCKRFLKGKKMENKDKVITTQELDEALTVCIKVSQRNTFCEEITRLSNHKEVKSDSKLKSFTPYLDDKGILRVGGRLRHSELSEETKHPIILDYNNYLSSLIVKDAHQKTLHGGIQMMMTYIRSKFWIIKAKTLIKTRIRKCIICSRHNASAKNQLMGDLPKVRVTPSKAFLNSGVDFAGPFLVLSSRGRGVKTTKAYIAVFVCMATKAVHLELVGDLTTESFIAAFKRFVARRGRCSDIWSDQGRNFIGANKELAAAWKDAKFEFESSSEALALDGTQWHYIPVYSPNMGGLWESNVKSVKHHLKRILTKNATYEELSTLLCQIEACLNSRPLSLTDDTDIDNMNPLTPGHFLVGEALMTVPQVSYKYVSCNNLSRWQHLQKLLADFWQKWQLEYLTSLQQRPKWVKKCKELDIGHIVSIKSDNLPPGKWALGRIVDKHPGDDGVTRVYSVKSGNNVTKRSFNKLCPLPVDID